MSRAMTRKIEQGASEHACGDVLRRDAQDWGASEGACPLCSVGWGGSTGDTLLGWVGRSVPAWAERRDKGGRMQYSSAASPA